MDFYVLFCGCGCNILFLIILVLHQYEAMYGVNLISH